MYITKIKNKQTGKIYYLQFFGTKVKERIWFTRTPEASGFNYGHINNFDPVDGTWENIQNEN